MTVVIDASVVVKWLLPEAEREHDTDNAIAVLRAVEAGSLEPLQPPHWLAEAAAVITRRHPDVAPRAVDLLYALELTTIDDLEVYRRAVALARELRLHVFDTLYHALALEYDATLITADERYGRKAGDVGGLVSLHRFTVP